MDISFSFSCAVDPILTAQLGAFVGIVFVAFIVAFMIARVRV